MWLCTPLIDDRVRLKIVDALLTLTVMTYKQSLDVQQLYGNRIVILDSQYIVSMYDRIHPKVSRPPASTIHVLCTVNDVGTVDFRPFGLQFTAYRFIHKFKLYIAQLQHLSSSSSSAWFQWCTISNVQNLDLVHQAGAESYSVQSTEQCAMMVAVHPGSDYASTALSLTRMTSLT